LLFGHAPSLGFQFALLRAQANQALPLGQLFALVGGLIYAVYRAHAVQRSAK
jgi:hypothetical protein